MLDLHNKIKIITSTEDTFALWSELISKYSQGELLYPETSPPEERRSNPKWIPHKDGILNREFFKWLPNCDEEDHKKLVRHLLCRSGEKRFFSYPKVTVKKTSKLLEDC